MAPCATTCARYAYRDADTEDFERVCERRYGRSLAWFFREWIYGTSRPSYAADWTSTPDTARGDSGYVIALTIRQPQSDAAPFTMPVDVSVCTANGEVSRVLWDSLATQTFALRVRGRPRAVTIDPGGWILKRIAQGPDLLLEEHPGHQVLWQQAPAVR